ncbi:hypothetical protein vseg_013392 [Gypsophila vaccaria]
MPKLQDALKPTQAQIPKSSDIPTLTAQNFKIDSGFIRCVQVSQFDGAHNEDLAEHIQNSIDFCNTIKQQGVDPQKLREMMFPFSLQDKAKKWLNKLNRTGRGNTDQDGLDMAFYEEYFPVEKTKLLRSQITRFCHMADETLWEALEKYNDFLSARPHQGLEESFLYTPFYHSLTPESKQTLNFASSNGIFGNIETAQVRLTIDWMARMHT